MMPFLFLLLIFVALAFVGFHFLYPKKEEGLQNVLFESPSLKKVADSVEKIIPKLPPVPPLPMLDKNALSVKIPPPTELHGRVCVLMPNNLKIECQANQCDMPNNPFPNKCQNILDMNYTSNKIDMSVLLPPDINQGTDAQTSAATIMIYYVASWYKMMRDNQGSLHRQGIQSYYRNTNNLFHPLYSFSQITKTNTILKTPTTDFEDLLFQDAKNIGCLSVANFSSYPYNNPPIDPVKKVFKAPYPAVPTRSNKVVKVFTDNNQFITIKKNGLSNNGFTLQNVQFILKQGIPLMVAVLPTPNLNSLLLTNTNPPLWYADPKKDNNPISGAVEETYLIVGYDDSTVHGDQYLKDGSLGTFLLKNANSTKRITYNYFFGTNLSIPISSSVAPPQGKSIPPSPVVRLDYITLVKPTG